MVSSQSISCPACEGRDFGTYPVTDGGHADSRCALCHGSQSVTESDARIYELEEDVRQLRAERLLLNADLTHARLTAALNAPIVACARAWRETEYGSQACDRAEHRLMEAIDKADDKVRVMGMARRVA
jgi:hypothetical protein